MLSYVRLEDRDLVGDVASVARLTPGGDAVDVLLRLVMENDAQIQYRGAFVQTRGKLFPSSVESSRDRPHMPRRVMLSFQQPPRHRQDLVDVHVDVHRAHGEVLVLLLEIQASIKNHPFDLHRCSFQTCSVFAS